MFEAPTAPHSDTRNVKASTISLQSEPYTYCKGTLQLHDRVGGDSEAVSPQATYTNRSTAEAGVVSAGFAGTGCRMVSATDLHGRLSRF
jgi:hypothetical protein